MKSFSRIVVFCIFSFLLFFAFAVHALPQDSPRWDKSWESHPQYQWQKGEAKREGADFYLLQKGLDLLERKYNPEFGKSAQRSIPLEAIKLVEQPRQFALNYAKANGLVFSEADLRRIEQSATWGIDRFAMPIMVNTTSQFWSGAQRVYKQKSYDGDMLTFVSCAIAAMLDHEIVFHNSMGETDEVKAHEFEKSSFAGLLELANSKTWNDQARFEADQYLENLSLLVALLQREVLQKADSPQRVRITTSAAPSQPSKQQ